MTLPAIQISGLSKSYKVYDSPRGLFLEALFGRSRHRTFQALDDISITVEKGSVVGLIGRNGAGKSTLLKILSGTLEETLGEVSVYGRISAILELGTGFNPDYTGRQNIYLGGLCLGLSKREIRNLEQEIIEFSELEEFIDQPFRTYSSGMQARLTFSVSVSVSPDILIVDEALSVGDARFQRKCFRKFEEFKKNGCTILFVTHQTSLVEAICDKVVYLNKGKIVSQGEPKDVVGLYMRHLFGGEDSKENVQADSANIDDEKIRYGTGEVVIKGIGVKNETGEECSILTSGEKYTIYCDVKCQIEVVDDLNVGISFTTKDGIVVFGANPILHQSPIPVLRRNDMVQISLDVEANIGPGDYFITFGAWGVFADKHYDRRVDALHVVVRGAPELAGSIVNMRPVYRSKVVNYVENRI